MLYSSRNGCFYYYDSLLFRWHVAEPTLLFLLGLEAITSYDKSISDSIVISKYVYKTYIDKLDPLEYIHEVYDDIYSFLSKIGSVEDHENYLKFNCYGLKLLLNDMTGTSNDRTVPFIFKYDHNKSLVDPANEKDTDPKLSYYDIQAQRIYDVFNNIGYDTSLEKDPVTNKVIPEYYIDRSKAGSSIKEIIDYLSVNVEDRPLRRTIINNVLAYNNLITTVHKKRLSDSEIYRLLDYKAMYAYALGVLYGCRCLGFDDSIIWRVDPKFWYNDVYFNLVRTAWFVFRFHWTYLIEDITSSEEDAIEYAKKYQSIQDNKIWNFYNTPDIINATLAKDETNCFCLYLGNNNHTVSEQLMYSYSTNESDDSQYPGSFLRKYMSLNNGRIIWKWFPIDSKISDTKPLKGVVSSRDASMTRYIGNDPVVIYRAYKYEEDSSVKYLAPKYEINELGDTKFKKYYVYTGDLGWVDYTEDLVLDIEHEQRHKYLNIVPKQPLSTELEYAFPIEPSAQSPSVVTYYKCYVTDHVTYDEEHGESDNDSDILYGVYNKFVGKQDAVPTNFDYIISSELFKAKYESSSTDTYGNVYSSSTYYDLSSPIMLVVRKDTHGVPYIWDGNTNTHDDIPVYYYGYSEKPSTLLTLYNLYDTGVDSDQPNKEVFRYYIDSDTDKFWSEEYFNSKDITSKTAHCYYPFLESSDVQIRLLIDAATPGALGNLIKLRFTQNSDNDCVIDVYNNESLCGTCIIPYSDFSSDNIIKSDQLNHLTITPADTSLPQIPITTYVYFSGSLDINYIINADSHELIITLSGGSDETTNHGRTWRTLSELSEVAESNSNPLYSMTNKVTNIYKGEIRLVSDTPIYNDYVAKASDVTPLGKFIYGDSKALLGNISIPKYKFMLLGEYSSDIDPNTLYAHGITTHLCPFVLTDDNGNSLLDDDGVTPLVWYDPEYEVYWNGLYNINRWQSTKPSRNSMSMFDAITRELIPVFDNADEQLISIDGADAITYDEFYSHPNWGVIRKTLQVFNPAVSSDIKECYCDTKLDDTDYTNALYCIPGHTGDSWVSRSEVHNLGWWFVDGTATLYSGNVGENCVVDDDHSD